MTRRLAYSMAPLLAVLASCADPVAPNDERRNWKWPEPLATGMGGDPTLICTPTTVSVGGFVSCAFANGGPLSTPAWHFEGEGGLWVTGPSMTGGWAGYMVLSGDVVVDYAWNGMAQQLKQTVTVQRRTTGWTWASTVAGSVLPR